MSRCIASTVAIAFLLGGCAEAPSPSATIARQLLINETPPPGQSGPSAVFVVDLATGRRAPFPEAGSPSWTPDGRIIYVSFRSGSQQVWIADADGGHARQVGQLPPERQPLMPQLGANGVVLFAGTDEQQPVWNGEVNIGIWTMREDGTGLREVARGMQPYLARSGTWLTYTVQTEGPMHRQVWRANVDGSGAQQLTFLGDPDYPDANASAISPDERWVAIFSGHESTGIDQPVLTWGHRNVAIVPATGGPRRTVTPCRPVTTQEELDRATGCFAADNPAWSPDGSRLIFDQGGRAGTQTWTADPEGGNYRLFYLAPRGMVRVPLR